MAKSKRHTVLVTLSFDKPVSRAEALKEYRKGVDGSWYAGDFSDASLVKVTSARSAPATTKKDGSPC